MLKIMSLSDLFGCDYTISEIYTIKQNKKDGKTYDSPECPRNTSAFIWYKNAEAVYGLGKGKTLEVKKGDVVYIPQNTTYSTTFYNTNENSSVLLEFKLTDKYFIDIIFNTEVCVLGEGYANCCRQRMEEILVMYKSPVQPHAKIKAEIFSILSEMGEIQRNRDLCSDQYEIIKKGILYLEEDKEQLLSLDDVAAMCNVSNSYFRRLFKQYSGVSPIEYRYNRKISRAMENLKKSYLSVEEISQVLGFETSSYFCRIFKKKTGLTPLEYRKKYMETIRK